MRTLLFAGTLCLAATGLHAETVYNGDKLNGAPVITKLDVSDLKPGIHQFMFKGADNGIGQSWYIPVMVAKGAKDGKKLLINSIIHGDELNSVRVVQKTFDQIDPAKLSGSVVGVIGANPAGMLINNRQMPISTDGGSLIDMNRVFPGKENGNPAEQHAWRLWNKLWAGNADMVIDLHTKASGAKHPLFIYADYRLPEVRTIAELIPADQIKKDPGQKGTIETTFDENKIPAVTVEIGQAKALQPEYIDRTVTGIRNVMVHYKMLDGALGATAKSHGAYIGNKMTMVKATEGGFVEPQVELGAMVKQGQQLAVQRNAFGKTVKTYTAPVSGKVLLVMTDPMREPGAHIVWILEQSGDASCAEGC